MAPAGSGSPAASRVGSGARGIDADIPRKLKIAVLADEGRVPRFALEAIDRLDGCDEIIAISCTNTRVARRPFRHGAYYALNLLSVRNPMTAQVPLSAGSKPVARSIVFESGFEGIWQTLPEWLIEEMGSSGFDLVLKFGMNLLRVPPDEALPPILSYHHGDPDHYRGRPAGFWELMNGAPVMGQVIQVLSNRLDAGRIAAFAETKVHRHSYRATLMEAYRHSPLLLNRAVRAVLGGDYVEKPCTGTNYRLPSNASVLRLVWRMARRSLRRLAYGATVEKRWNVSTAACSAGALLEASRGGAFPPPSEWRTVPVPKEYVFCADPFFSEDPPGLLVEALNRRTAVGDILLLQGETSRRLSDGTRHFSYPFPFRKDGVQLIVPEMAEWSSPKTFVIEDGVLRERSALAFDETPRLMDPTLIEHGGTTYLFGNILSVGSGALFLWMSSSVDHPFRTHPCTPVRISPRGARMAGSLVRVDGRLIRFGQDLATDYGDGILVFEVDELTPTGFAETLIGELRLKDRPGPHTLSLQGGEIAFDWYRHRVSLLAGVRRLLGRRRRLHPDERMPRTD
jgi:hypothetical protein